MKKIAEVKSLQLGEIEIKVKGVTPLLMEKMDEEVVEKYNKKKAGKSVEKKHSELEEDKVEDKIHYDEKGNVVFPSAGFYKGMIEVAPYIDTIKYKKTVRGSIRMMEGLIPITFKKKKTNTTWGRTSGISKAPRKIVRPEFEDWSCTLKIRYNTKQITAEQIVNLVNLAGFHMGVGGWRPEKEGMYGQYEVCN